MKKIFFVFAALLLIISCSKKDFKFEAFSAEAFTFDLGDGTAEVNSTVRVKGFTQIEKDDNYYANVAFEVDLLKPDSTITKSVFKFVKNEEKAEPINDIALEAQFALDSSYQSGTYTLVYRIMDKNSDNSLETNVSFDLQW
jgi:major membrane immunogen (membrane-anchored lipoprotein)